MHAADKQEKIDWNSTGTYITDDLLTESWYVSQVDRVYGTRETEDSCTVNTSSEMPWQFDYEKNKVVVFKKKNINSKLLCFCGRGVVNAPYRVVAEFIKDPESSFLYGDYIIESKYVKKLAETPSYIDYLGYQLYSSTHCFSLLQRDMLCFIRCQYRDGKYVQAAISAEDDEYPLQKNRPRCEVFSGTGTVVEPYRGSPTTSLVSYFTNIDIKGLPLFIANRVSRKSPMTVQIIQRNFEPQQEHSSSPPPPSLTMPPTPPLSPTPSHTTQHEPTQRYEEELSMEAFMKRLQ